MVFHSILFETTVDSTRIETLEAPVFFVDLNLDQVIDAITAGKEEYNLKPFFYTSLNDTDAIKYRQEIARDLENTVLGDMSLPCMVIVGPLRVPDVPLIVARRLLAQLLESALQFVDRLSDLVALSCRL